MEQNPEIEIIQNLLVFAVESDGDELRVHGSVITTLT